MNCRSRVLISRLCVKQIAARKFIVRFPPIISAPFSQMKLEPNARCSVAVQSRGSRLNRQLNGKRFFGAPPGKGKLMIDRSNGATVRKHQAILRVSAVGVAGLLSALMLTAVAPPIVADQSDRAVVNAPVTLLTAPISGEIGLLAVLPGRDVRDGDTLAQISNPRVDRGTLITLQEKASDARQKLDATRAKHESDLSYVSSLDDELANQTNQLKAQFKSQIEELRARVAQSNAMSGEK